MDGAGGSGFKVVMTNDAQADDVAQGSVEKILRAAEIEFGTRGLDAVSVQHIADRAGVSSKLIYHYFSKKSDLYAEAMVRMTRRLLEIYRQDGDSKADPLAAIHAFARSYCEYQIRHPHLGLLVVDQVVQHGSQIKRDARAGNSLGELLNHLRDVVALGKGSGSIKPDVSAEGVLFLTMIVTLGYTTMTTLLGPTTFIVPELASDVDIAAKVADIVTASVR
jgi:AcrR family transcriptional regulator